MKLNVIKAIAQRTGEPKVSSPLVKYLLPGDSIILAKVLWGEIIDGNGIWYQSDEGNYYWSGGFAEVNFSVPGLNLNDYPEEDRINILKQLRERAHAVFKQNIRGYLGCGFGDKNHDPARGAAFLVYVDRKLALEDPALEYRVVQEVNFWGFKLLTDVIAIGTALHQDGEVSSPLIGKGITVRIDNETHVGTRSLGVKRRRTPNSNEFDFFLLASYHVVLSDLISGASNYAGDPERHCIFLINNSVPADHLVTEGCYNVNYDYVAIRLKADETVLNEIDEKAITGFFEIDEINSLKGQTVHSLGFISARLRPGEVLSTFNKVTLQPHNQEFEDVIFTKNISTDGDSGAPVIEMNSKKLLGFIIGGNGNDLSYILPFYNLRHEKHFEIS